MFLDALPSASTVGSARAGTGNKWTEEWRCTGLHALPAAPFG